MLAHISATSKQGGGDTANASMLRRSRFDPVSTQRLRELLAKDVGPVVARYRDADVMEEVAKRVESGRWTMSVVTAPQTTTTLDLAGAIEAAKKGAGAGGSGSSSKDPTKDKKLDWIEIELIDSRKYPVKGAKVALTLPDGSVIETTLNDKGALRKDGIDPGTCKVKFPDLCGKEWSKTGSFAEGKSVELFKGAPKIPAGPYKVKQGDHIAAIAHDAGFVSWKTIWDDGKNAALKAKRNGNVLFPGDTIEIPAKQKKEESVPTGEYHTFQTIGDPLQLKIVMLDWAGNPLPDIELDLQVDKGEKIRTAGDGSVKKNIDPSCDRIGKMVVNGQEIEVRLGHLDPVEEISGQEGRLENLGYDPGHKGDPKDPKFLSAVEEFQCDYGLTVDGDCGPNTQAKLKEVHGS